MTLKKTPNLAVLHFLLWHNGETVGRFSQPFVVVDMRWDLDRGSPGILTESGVQRSWLLSSTTSQQLHLYKV
jgi:hypothetical protein